MTAYLIEIADLSHRSSMCNMALHLYLQSPSWMFPMDDFRQGALYYAVLMRLCTSRLRFRARAHFFISSFFPRFLVFFFFRISLFLAASLRSFVTPTLPHMDTHEIKSMGTARTGEILSRHDSRSNVRVSIALCYNHRRAMSQRKHSGYSATPRCTSSSWATCHPGKPLSRALLLSAFDVVP